MDYGCNPATPTKKAEYKTCIRLFYFILPRLYPLGSMFTPGFEDAVFGSMFTPGFEDAVFGSMFTPGFDEALLLVSLVGMFAVFNCLCSILVKITT